jgi:Protein of unknown function (DUF2824)
MIRRTFDPAEVNAIVNDPEVFKQLKLPGIESVDLSSTIFDLRNVVLMVNGGCIVFSQLEPGIYEVHTNFLADYRGSNAIRQSLAAYRWMFTRTDCMVLHTKVPAFNKAAEVFCRLVGATKEFDRTSLWPTENGLVDMSFWTLRYDDWVRKTPSLKKSGREFHERFDRERLRHGITEENHPDEDCHDLYVGVCAETFYGGQPEKAVILYNQWARFSGYAPISLISLNPIVIDIASAALLVEDGTFTVIKCQPQH